MPKIQRFAHSIQRITYVNFFRPEPRDLRPEEITAPATRLDTPNYAAWSATSYSGFVPFSSPTSR